MAGITHRGRGRMVGGHTRQEILWRILVSPGLWRRLGLVAVAAGIMWLSTGGWAPPFPWRSGYAPERDLTARVPFSTEDRRATDQARQKARAEVVPYYQHDPALIQDFGQAITNPLLTVIAAESAAGVPDATWQELLRPVRAPSVGSTSPARNAPRSKSRTSKSRLPTKSSRRPSRTTPTSPDSAAR